jgi:nucleoside-triphosphatase THEP1
MLALTNKIPESKLLRAVRFCWDNLDTLISIFLAVTAVWFSLVGAKAELAIAATATILALVAFGLMRDRSARSSLAADLRQMHEIVLSLKEGPNPDIFFGDRPNEKEYIIRADKELILIQETGRLIAETCRRELVAFLQRGGRLRWICTLDDQPVIQMMSLRNKNLLQDQLIADRMTEGVKMVQILASEARASSSNLEVRFLPYPPDITGVLADSTHNDQSRREAMIRLQGFQLTFEDKLEFKIRERWSPSTFELYRSQAESMWKSSTKCIFLTGRPGIGKSTILGEVIDVLRETGIQMAGFLTRDVRNSAGERIGFDTSTLDGSRSGPLARKGEDGEYHINISTMENVVIATLKAALSKPPQLLVVDEIGPIQLKDPLFQGLVENVLEMRAISLLGIVALTGHSYISNVRQFYRTGILEVNESNRNDLKGQLLNDLSPRSSH